MDKEDLLQELREAVEPYVADKGTEAASEAIHENGKTHTSMLWQDGEVTYQKNGDLWGARRLHQWNEPFLPPDMELWDVPEGKENTYKVVTDSDGLREVIDSFKEEHMSQYIVRYDLPQRTLAFSEEDALGRADSTIAESSENALKSRIQHCKKEVEELDQ